MDSERFDHLEASALAARHSMRAGVVGSDGMTVEERVFWGEDIDVFDVLDLTKAIRDMEQALYDVYVAIGEPTEGARDYRELFGPMRGLYAPHLVPHLVRKYREEMERDE